MLGSSDPSRVGGDVILMDDVDAPSAWYRFEAALKRCILLDVSRHMT
jgi:hypothetical protein